MFGNVLIFGDSYSTFKGYIPDGYACYYHEDGGNTDVRKVSQTWWHQLMSETGSHLCMNNSWSGSTICHTGYNNVDCSQTSSFIYRLRKLIKDGFFENNVIDTVFIFGGTNDNWAGAPVGEVKYSCFEEKDLFYILPAVCYLIKEFKEILPEARIVFVINTGFKPEISSGIADACEYYGTHSVQLTDLELQQGHPGINAMTGIKDQILQSFK